MYNNYLLKVYDNYMASIQYLIPHHNLANPQSLKLNKYFF